MIGGAARGRRLVAPPGDARPTTDRVREALFNVLGPGPVRGAAVLDLYAGSGALGIEALSRGASRAVFVERDSGAVAAIESNLVATGFTELARVRRLDVRAHLARPDRSGPFDLVLIDPPYATPGAEVEATLAALADRGWLGPGAVVTVERARVDGVPALPTGWGIEFERAYGDTLLLVVAP